MGIDLRYWRMAGVYPTDRMYGSLLHWGDSLCNCASGLTRRDRLALRIFLAYLLTQYDSLYIGLAVCAALQVAGSTALSIALSILGNQREENSLAWFHNGEEERQPIKRAKMPINPRLEEGQEVEENEEEGAEESDFEEEAYVVAEEEDDSSDAETDNTMNGDE